MAISKVLIIRFSSIGDVILTSPVVRCIKLQKQVELHYLTKKVQKVSLEYNPYIDQLHYLEDGKELIGRLKEEHFDLIIDLHNNIRSRWFRRKLSVKAFGFYKANVEKWLKVNLKLNLLPTKHLVDRYFEGIEEWGVVNDGQGLDYFLGQNALNKAEDLIRDIKTFITISLGASYVTKRIPLDKCAKWIEGFPTAHFVLLGGMDVKEDAMVLKERFGDRVTQLCGEVGLQTTAALIKMSQVHISGDTATMHIAAALGTPLLDVWGNTIPEFGMYPYYGKKAKRNISFEQKELSCRPCSKLGHQKCPKGHFKCMMDHDDSRLIQELHRLTT